jgi:CheY-like chemotaxis protein/HPt (histidine-containing phosphotransfer) domain-containing protein
VLVVEDNATNQRVARAMLEALGCRVELASDGEAALARIAGAFDLVLMDCQMPVRDGYATAREWRRLERGRRTPIVALTAHSLPGEREKCLDAGMDDHATKPFTLAALEALLARWAAPAPGAPAPATPPAPLAATPALRARFDPAAIAALRALDPDDTSFATTLVEEFVDRWAAMRRQAHDALADGDAASVRSLAHQLKSNCGQLGAGVAADAAAALERAAREGAPASALAPLLAALESELAAVLPEVLAAVGSERKTLA